MLANVSLTHNLPKVSSNSTMDQIQGFQGETLGTQSDTNHHQLNRVPRKETREGGDGSSMLDVLNFHWHVGMLSTTQYYGATAHPLKVTEIPFALPFLSARQ